MDETDRLMRVVGIVHFRRDQDVIDQRSR
jgi:hypothetical protein